MEPLGAAESRSAEVRPLTPVIISFVFSVVYIFLRRDNNSFTSCQLRPCSFVLSCRRSAQGRDGVSRSPAPTNHLDSFRDDASSNAGKQPSGEGWGKRRADSLVFCWTHVLWTGRWVPSRFRWHPERTNSGTRSRSGEGTTNTGEGPINRPH